MPDDVQQELVERLEAAGWSLATAESVTAGLVANAAAQSPRATGWFRGGLVAWQPEVKQAQLGVEPGPVVNAGPRRRWPGGWPSCWARRSP